MPAYRIGYLVGSLASGSINRTLSKALIRLAPDDLEFTEIPIRDLPLYDHDLDDDFPAEGRAFKDAIEASDALLFVSPEYNRSIPGGLKNAIDWGSRPWGSNSFAHKPAAIIGASPGSTGTAIMQSSMRSVMSFLEMPQLNSPEGYITFNAADYRDDGEVTNEGTAEFLGHYMAEAGAFVRRLVPVSEPRHIREESPLDYSSL
jgi:chromate reductase